MYCSWCCLRRRRRSWAQVVHIARLCLYMDGYGPAKTQLALCSSTASGLCSPCVINKHVSPHLHSRAPRQRYLSCIYSTIVLAPQLFPLRMHCNCIADDSAPLSRTAKGQPAVLSESSCVLGTAKHEKALESHFEIAVELRLVPGLQETMLCHS